MNHAGGITINQDVERRTLALKAPERIAEPWIERAAELVATAKESCAIDVAERGGATLAEIGRMLGVTREAVRQLESVSKDSFRDEYPNDDE